jgi:hypothetical protein
MFELLATLKAILRLDFKARVDERRKYPLSAAIEPCASSIKRKCVDSWKVLTGRI